MRRIFADTFYFLALINPRDEAHKDALEYPDAGDVEIVTTAWVLTELADALSDVAGRPIFLRTLAFLQDNPLNRIVPASQDLFERGVKLYASRPDKEWSLTDCISFVVMQQDNIQEALTGDRHFAQAGFKALLG